MVEELAPVRHPPKRSTAPPNHGMTDMFCGKERRVRRHCVQPGSAFHSLEFGMPLTDGPQHGLQFVSTSVEFDGCSGLLSS
jgi:hypothetical protein